LMTVFWSSCWSVLVRSFGCCLVLERSTRGTSVDQRSTVSIFTPLSTKPP
jgi:hypothetical protein